MNPGGPHSAHFDVPVSAASWVGCRRPSSCSRGLPDAAGRAGRCRTWPPRPSGQRWPPRRSRSRLRPCWPSCCRTRASPGRRPLFFWVASCSAWPLPVRRARRSHLRGTTVGFKASVRTAGWVAAAFAVGAGSILVELALAFVTPESFSQTFDNVVPPQRRARTSSTPAAPRRLTMSKMTSGDAAPYFYPAAWHGLAAALIQLTGLPIAGGRQCPEHGDCGRRVAAGLHAVDADGGRQPARRRRRRRSPLRNVRGVPDPASGFRRPVPEFPGHQHTAGGPGQRALLFRVARGLDMAAPAPVCRAVC